MQTIYRHREEISKIVSGTVVYGDDGLEVVYGCPPSERQQMLRTDCDRLASSGYAARIVGASKLIAIDLRNVGSVWNARYEK